MPRPYVAGNEVTLLADGTKTFERALAAIDDARERVWLETFIFEPDAAGMRVLLHLTRAARRGLDVILIVDRMGSRQLRDKHLREFREAGGHAVWFNTLLGVRKTGRKVTPLGMHRDHRKIFLVDDHTAFVGGRNVSMDYGGRGDDVFYDVMIEIRGPAVREVADVFLETLGDAAHLRRELFPPAEKLGEVDVRVLQLDLREEVSDLDRALLDLIQNAKHELRFCTPYLLPSPSVIEALSDAARRGVDVRVLTAGWSDVPKVKVAGRHLYKTLIEHGVRVFEMTSHPLHAKFYVSDRFCSIVGSYNADRWGQRYNQEVAAQVRSGELADGLRGCFADGAEREVTLDDIKDWSAPRRALQAVLYGMSKVLAPARREID